MNLKNSQIDPLLVDPGKIAFAIRMVLNKTDLLTPLQIEETSEALLLTILEICACSPEDSKNFLNNKSELLKRIKQYQNIIIIDALQKDLDQN